MRYYEDLSEAPVATACKCGECAGRHGWRSKRSRRTRTILRRLVLLGWSIAVGIPLGATITQSVVAAWAVSLLESSKVRAKMKGWLVQRRLPVARVLTSARKND